MVTCVRSFVTKRRAGKNRAILGLPQGSETVFVSNVSGFVLRLYDLSLPPALPQPSPYWQRHRAGP